ncbi:MAG TPA: dethiobiotin synthase, partial [Cupriavidus sp.]|nr:dethiobiotin synthase [Cupriavidus sp.]
RLAGWIANRIDPDMLLPSENIVTLQDALEVPLLGELPWQVAPAVAAQYLDLAPLLSAAPSVVPHHSAATPRA